MVRKERWLVHSSVLQHMIIRSLSRLRLSLPRDIMHGRNGRVWPAP